MVAEMVIEFFSWAAANWKEAPKASARNRTWRSRRVRFTASSQAAELFHGFLDGFEFFDVRVHRVLFEIQILREFESLRGGGARNDHHAISIGNHDVRGIHRDSITNDGNVGAGEAVMAD